MSDAEPKLSDQEVDELLYTKQRRRDNLRALYRWRGNGQEILIVNMVMGIFLIFYLIDQIVVPMMLDGFTGIEEANFPILMFIGVLWGSLIRQVRLQRRVDALVELLDIPDEGQKPFFD